MHQPSISFHARSNDGKSGDYVALDLMKDGHVLGTWLLTTNNANSLADELAKAANWGRRVIRTVCVIVGCEKNAAMTDDSNPYCMDHIPENSKNSQQWIV